VLVAEEEEDILVPVVPEDLVGEDLELLEMRQQTMELQTLVVEVVVLAAPVYL